jgi:hypothetical protein
MGESTLEERFRSEGDRLQTAAHTVRETRAAAGMGFWRLAIIVAVGILIAKIASVIALFLWAQMTAPGILRT